LLPRCPREWIKPRSEPTVEVIVTFLQQAETR